jgi:hypothetical protein
MDTQTLSILWIEAKEAEKQAQEKRRQIEDKLLSLMGIAPFEGTYNEEVGEYKIKLTGRFNRKIDSDRLQEVAEENGLSDHLPSLFRWKPEINMTNWKRTDESITTPLLEAITTTQGRPSFSIERKETK